MCTGVFPRLCLNLFSRVLLHFAGTSATLFVALIVYLKHDEGIILKADPISTVIISIVLSVITFPAFYRSTPFLIGSTPKDFKIDKFKEEITAMFPSVTCDHIHVYRRWPGNAFDAFLSITYRCSMEESSWSDAVETDIIRIQREIRSVLTKAGAKSVTIQPNIVSWGAFFESGNCVQRDCDPKSCCRRDVYYKTVEPYDCAMV